mmetsp:Transcript_17226/g.26608  ORF Transcript_17226/g.26608 Transcript_17226/m.26608 type:complete len:118 (+) Transcript_17226:464-817(+)
MHVHCSQSSKKKLRKGISGVASGSAIMNMTHSGAKVKHAEFSVQNVQPEQQTSSFNSTLHQQPMVQPASNLLKTQLDKVENSTCGLTISQLGNPTQASFPSHTKMQKQEIKCKQFII